MIESNNHTNYHFKLVLLKSKWQLFLLSGLVMQVLLVGCTAKDEEAPVITSVKVEDNVVTIEASDNVGVTSYISVSNPRQPSLTDEKWQESNAITLDEDGPYYIWVKDASDNLAQYSEIIEMSYNLAQKFDHLNWLTPAEGTRVVDGVTYNLAELKAEYGNLYRLVEPLNDGQIENRFEYLARFMELQMNEALSCNCQNWYPYGGFKINNDVSSIASKQIDKDISIIFSSNNSIFDLFRNYYYYNEFMGEYVNIYPKSFDSKQGVWGVGTDTINKANISEKEFFVRDFIYHYENIFNTYKQLGLEPEYAIENWDWNK